MKPQETKAIYEQACRSKRITPQQEEGEKWHKVLRGFDERDVRAAIDAWWGSTDRDRDGELKSRWLPEPAELKGLAEREQHRREVAAATPKDLIFWECSSCRKTCCGFYPRGQATPAVPCRWCSSVLVAVKREAAA